MLVIAKLVYICFVFFLMLFISETESRGGVERETENPRQVLCSPHTA